MRFQGPKNEQQKERERDKGKKEQEKPFVFEEERGRGQKEKTTPKSHQAKKERKRATTTASQGGRVFGSFFISISSRSRPLFIRGQHSEQSNAKQPRKRVANRRFLGVAQVCRSIFLSHDTHPVPDFLENTHC